MDIYLYWPFARHEDLELFESIPGPADQLTLHTLDRAGTPTSDSPRLEIRADLADVDVSYRPPDPRWAASRATTYARRSRGRAAVLRHGGFDVAHLAFLNQYTDIGAVRRIGRSVPLVVTVHDVVPHTRRLPRTVQHRLLRTLYSSCGAIVVHHDEVRHELLQSFDIDPDVVTVVPHWVSQHRTDPHPRVMADPPTALFLGTLRPNKGVEVLIEAMDLLRDAPWHLTIAGRGDPTLEALVRRAADRLPNVHAEIGWVTPERKRELLLGSDLCVLPYTSFSSQSGVLHDAYGAHVPVVVTDVGALGASVNEAGTGLVVRPGRAQELAAAIAKMLSHPPTWQAASCAAMAIARHQSTVAIGASLRDVYETAARRP